MDTDEGTTRPPQAQLRGVTGGLGVIHWCVVSLSLVLTFFAWHISAKQLHEKQVARFERAANRVVDLVVERMEKYEVGLWAGVGLIQAQPEGASITRVHWQEFAQSLDFVRRLPGISGVGVIYHVVAPELSDYIARHAPEYPELEDFGPYPPVETEHHFPITYIEPFAPNRAAVGLDMASESSRADGARRAMLSGEAQITGPIVLVQDEGKTPGFLFFAPFYARADQGRELENFAGLVYAPFVVRDLMRGTLAESQRQVAVRISDGETVLYDELEPVASADHGAFSERKLVDLYGRRWRFDIHAGPGLVDRFEDAQPATILVGGLVIDSLLLGLFIALGRSHRAALGLAADMTVSLAESQRVLKRRNEELLQFNYRASHDLVSPLRRVEQLTKIAREDLADGEHEAVERSLVRVGTQASTMQALITDIFQLGRADQGEIRPEAIVPDELVEAVFTQHNKIAEERGVELRSLVDCPAKIVQDRVRLLEIISNLVSNGINYSHSKRDGFVQVSLKAGADFLEIVVEDNGTGIPEACQDRVFELFFRAHSQGRPGSGLGTAIVKRHVEILRGRVTFESSGLGTVFTVVLPPIEDAKDGDRFNLAS